MATWFQQPPVLNFDPDEASRILDRVFSDRKLIADNGDLRRKELATRLETLMIESHFVSSEAHLDKRAATKLELGLEFMLLPDEDGGEPGDATLIQSARTAEERAARNKLLDVVWDTGGVSLTSPLNRVMSRPGGYVLCETTVTRHFNSTERADLGELSEDRRARFVTKEFAIILSYSNDPEVKKFQAAADRYNRFLGEVQSRQPHLRLDMAKAGAAALPTVTGRVTNANVKAISALVAPAGELEAPDGEDIE